MSCIAETGAPLKDPRIPDDGLQLKGVEGCLCLGSSCPMPRRGGANSLTQRAGLLIRCIARRLEKLDTVHHKQAPLDSVYGELSQVIGSWKARAPGNSLLYSLSLSSPTFAFNFKRRQLPTSAHSQTRRMRPPPSRTVQFMILLDGLLHLQQRFKKNWKAGRPSSSP